MAGIKAPAPGSSWTACQTCQSHGQPAIDENHLPVEIPGPIRGDVRHGMSDLVGCAEPARWDGLCDLVLELLREVGSHIGFDEPWRDEVGRNAFGTQFLPQ